jgi:hypothetical protein
MQSQQKLQPLEPHVPRHGQRGEERKKMLEKKIDSTIGRELWEEQQWGLRQKITWRVFTSAFKNRFRLKMEVDFLKHCAGKQTNFENLFFFF